MSVLCGCGKWCVHTLDKLAVNPVFSLEVNPHRRGKNIQPPRRRFSGRELNPQPPFLRQTALTATDAYCGKISANIPLCRRCVHTTCVQIRRRTLACSLEVAVYTELTSPIFPSERVYTLREYEVFFALVFNNTLRLSPQPLPLSPPTLDI